MLLLNFFCLFLTFDLCLAQNAYFVFTTSALYNGKNNKRNFALIIWNNEIIELSLFEDKWHLKICKIYYLFFKFYFYLIFKFFPFLVGDLGGTSGADTKCKNAAATSQVSQVQSKWSSFRAYITTASVQARYLIFFIFFFHFLININSSPKRDRIYDTNTGIYQKADGTIVASNYNDLVFL